MFVSGRVGATKPARKIFDTALNTLGIENRKKVLMIGDSLKADIAGGTGAGIDTCWCNFRGAVLPEGAPQPTYTIQGYEELLRIVMEEEELANAGSKEKRHQL
ncbi:MAG: HAD-IA family hydrolase [Ruthenibacterium lactatiformans]